MKTAEEFLVRDELFKTPLIEEEKHYYIDRIITHDDYIKGMIEFAKMHVQEALKQASEKADADFTYLGDDLKEIGAEYIEVYTIKDSILNAYPLDLIK